MNLSAPKTTTFMIALVLGILGFLGFVVQLPFITANAFWLLLIGFVILVVAVLVTDF